MASYYSRNGYDVTIIIGNQQVPQSQMHGVIRIQKSENGASLAEFTLLNPSGIQSPESYQGTNVYINIRTANGYYRAFTGKIDVPEVDLVLKKTTYNCTDNRENKINALPANYIDQIGYYSTEVFGTPNDNFDELRKRMSTIPYSFDFDNFGNPTLTSWTPKATPDYALGASAVYYRDPKVTFSSREKTINTVTIKLNYTYQRLHHHSLSFRWNGSYFTSPQRWYREGRPGFLSRDMVRSAANGVGYKIKGNITFTDLWPSQWFVYDGVNVYWSTQSVTGSSYRGVTDSSGDAVTDPNGNQQTELARITFQDTSSHLCIGARWDAYKRFAQNVIEQYTVSLSAPQSVGKFGTIPSEENVQISAEYDTKTWEDSADGATNTNYYINQDWNRGTYQAAMNVLMYKARTSLLNSHRDVRVDFQTQISPQYDLKHTLSVTTDPLKCRGKVSSIVHFVNIETGEAYTDVELSLSRITGSASNSTLSIPAVPSEASYIGDVERINLQSHYGEDPTTNRAASWNGHIGNKWIEGTAYKPTYRTKFPEAFIVDTPKIPDVLRLNRELTSSTAYTVSIPNDYLVLEF